MNLQQALQKRLALPQNPPYYRTMNEKQVTPVEVSDAEIQDLAKVSVEEQLPYDGFEGQWAGDGSGMDDFEDYNQNEGMDW